MKITSANYVHTCQLKADLHCEACQRAGSYQPGLNGVSDIIELLRNHLPLSISDLRPFVENGVVSDVVVVVVFMVFVVWQWHFLLW